MSAELTYCALCANETYTVWTISRGGEMAIVPLCQEHEPQLSRLFNLCKIGSLPAPVTPVDGQPRPRKQRTSALSFSPLLDWTPPGD